LNFSLTKHALTGNNDLFGLFFNGKRANKGSNFFSSFPLGQLTKTFLTGPDAGVNYLQKQLTRARVEDKYSTIYDEGSAM